MKKFILMTLFFSIFSRFLFEYSLYGFIALILFQIFLLFKTKVKLTNKNKAFYVFFVLICFLSYLFLFWFNNIYWGVSFLNVLLNVIVFETFLLRAPLDI